MYPSRNVSTLGQYTKCSQLDCKCQQLLAKEKSLITISCLIDCNDGLDGRECLASMPYCYCYKACLLCMCAAKMSVGEQPCYTLINLPTDSEPPNEMQLKQDLGEF